MKNKKIGWVLCVLLALIPAVIWGFMQSLSLRFSSFAASMISLGQLTGLVGTIFLCLTFVLSIRQRLLEDLFGGLDRVYIAHHIFGTLAFLLLLFHPIFLALKFLVFSASAALGFLLPGSNFSINFGIFSLVSMILFLLFTFFIKLRYDRWKITHKFLGLALLLAVVHILFIESDISRSFLLRVYIFVFILIALVSFFYKSILYSFIKKKYYYEIEEVQKNGDICQIRLKSKDGLVHTPGEFAFFSFPKISGEFHPFSIASSPNCNSLEICVKNLGDYTGNLDVLKKGDEAVLEGPYGRFNSSAKEQIWISGGIGVTPFLSMARTLGDKKADLYYCVKNKKEAVFLKEFENLAKKNKNLRVIPYYSDESGYLSVDFVEKNSKKLEGKEILVCGPPSMMDSLKKAFKNKGINIITEEFKLL